ncbi:hypothetical protein EV182_005204 [Spiromyces aspiralis]|uniref:Uncharacterized protein n=1 Tax=Spiromyces aspiralis TaxID=68401 RepID=A0ACC1HDP9_9FUNG|nr:hypothetical protein EV182_005204 [Spiromyces aspiralis]
MGQYWNLVCWDTQQKSRSLGKLGEFFYECSCDDYIIDTLSWQGCRIACIGDYTDEVPDPLTRAGVKVKLEADETFYRYVDDNFQEISRDMIRKIWKPKMVERAMTGEEEDLAEFVVLNESRQEYVVTNRRDFTKVILSLICWSDDPSVSMNTDYEIYRGPWAWDRISILSKGELELVAAGCKDITERIYRLVRNIVKEDAGEEFPSE